MYKIGDAVVLNSQALKQSHQLKKGDQVFVTKLHTHTNELNISHNGKNTTISAADLAKTYPTINDTETRQISIGDRVRFTATDLKGGYVSNQSAVVSKIEGNSVTLTHDSNNKTIMLDTSKSLHIDHDYAKTTFSSQGLTAENVIYHAQSSSTNLMNQRDFYVATSRATDSIQVVTDNKRELTDLVKQSSGEKEMALKDSQFNEHHKDEQKHSDKSESLER